MTRESVKKFVKENWKEIAVYTAGGLAMIALGVTAAKEIKSYKDIVGDCESYFDLSWDQFADVIEKNGGISRTLVSRETGDQVRITKVILAGDLVES